MSTFVWIQTHTYTAHTHPTPSAMAHAVGRESLGGHICIRFPALSFQSVKWGLQSQFADSLPHCFSEVLPSLGWWVLGWWLRAIWNPGKVLIPSAFL